MSFEITVIEARNLKDPEASTRSAAASLGSSVASVVPGRKKRGDLPTPYCKIKSGKFKAKTKEMNKTANPQWNETVILPDDDSQKEIWFVVKDASSNTSLGSFNVSKADVLLTGTFAEWISMGSDKGEIHIKIVFFKKPEKSLPTRVRGHNRERSKGDKFLSLIATAATSHHDDSRGGSHSASVASGDGSRSKDEKSIGSSESKSRSKKSRGPEVDLALEYNYLKTTKSPEGAFIGKLVVVVVAAKDLAGSGNYYCEISFEGSTERTQTTQSKSRDPEWNQRFEFKCRSTSSKIAFHVYMSHAGKEPDFCGRTLVNISELASLKEGMANEFKILEKRTSKDKVEGQLQLGLIWASAGIDPKQLAFSSVTTPKKVEGSSKLPVTVSAFNPLSRPKEGKPWVTGELIIKVMEARLKDLSLKEGKQLFYRVQFDDLDAPCKSGVPSSLNPRWGYEGTLRVHKFVVPSTVDDTEIKIKIEEGPSLEKTSTVAVTKIPISKVPLVEKEASLKLPKDKGEVVVKWHFAQYGQLQIRVHSTTNIAPLPHGEFVTIFKTSDKNSVTSVGKKLNPLWGPNEKERLPIFANEDVIIQIRDDAGLRGEIKLKHETYSTGGGDLMLPLQKTVSGDSNATARVIFAYSAPGTIHDEGIDPFLDRQHELCYDTPVGRQVLGTLAVRISDCTHSNSNVQIHFQGSCQKSDIPSATKIKFPVVSSKVVPISFTVFSREGFFLGRTLVNIGEFSLLPIGVLDKTLKLKPKDRKISVSGDLSVHLEWAEMDINSYSQKEAILLERSKNELSKSQSEIQEETKSLVAAEKLRLSERLKEEAEDAKRKKKAKRRSLSILSSGSDRKKGDRGSVSQSVDQSKHSASSDDVEIQAIAIEDIVEEEEELTGPFAPQTIVDHSKPHDVVYKVIIIGDSGVGKTGLMTRWVRSTFVETEVATIGPDNGKKLYKEDGKVIMIEIWDTAGQERFRAVNRPFYRGSLGAILTYSIDDRRSFNNLQVWVDEIQEHSPKCCIMLIATKLDLEKERAVPTHEGLAFARNHGMLFLETSAKSGKQCEKAFQMFLQEVHENNKHNFAHLKATHTTSTPSLVPSGGTTIVFPGTNNPTDAPQPTGTTCCGT